MSVRWMRPPSGMVGMIECDPATYAELLERGHLVVDGQHATVSARPPGRPADEQYDLNIRFDRPYVYPPRRLICEDAEMAARFLSEELLFFDSVAYIPAPTFEANVLALFEFVPGQMTLQAVSS